LVVNPDAVDCVIYVTLMSVTWELRHAWRMHDTTFAARGGFLRGILPVLCFGLAVWAPVQALPQAKEALKAPATILLIRHAEKLTDGRLDLSTVGFERAREMPLMFAGADQPGTSHNLPRPEFLFATHVSKHSNRPVETITPLSEALKLPISSEVDDKDFGALAKDLLSGKYAGKVVLVAWHHGSLPEFARALGAVPPYDPWPETQFDRVWRIDYKDGKATLVDLPQELLPGDSK
jgi:hypothetical protein